MTLNFPPRKVSPICVIHLSVFVCLSACLSSSLQETIKVVQPVLLGKLIMYFESYHHDAAVSLPEAYCYAGAMCVSSVAMALLHHLYFYHVQMAGMKIRIAVCHMIYRKVRATLCYGGKQNIS